MKMASINWKCLDIGKYIYKYGLEIKKKNLLLSFNQTCINEQLLPKIGFPVPSKVFSFSFLPCNPLCLSGVVAFLGGWINWFKKEKTLTLSISIICLNSMWKIINLKEIKSAAN